MRARVLVLKVIDGHDAYVEAACIASEFTMDDNPQWLLEQAATARTDYGKSLLAHGFVDIEIPNDVIDQVLRRQADAGVVKAEPVEAVTDGAEVES